VDGAVVSLIVQSVVGASVLAGSITTLVHAIINVYVKRGAESSSPRAELTPEMRDEIEQNEAWWLRSFHNLLEEAGTPELVRVPGEWSRDGYGALRQRRDYVALTGCICYRCAYALKKSKEQTKIPLHNGNVQVIRELQSKLGVMADGIVGPATMRVIESNDHLWHADMSQDAWALYFELKIPELSGVIERYKAAEVAQYALPRHITSITKSGVTLDINQPEPYKAKRQLAEAMDAEIAFWKSVA
jgi:hypothetical protein